MDLNIQLEEIKKKIKTIPLNGEESEIKLYADYLSLLAQLAEAHLQDHYREWENAAYVKEYLHFAPALMAYADDTYTLYTIGKRLSESFNEHPRLKVVLLNWMKQLLNRPEIKQQTAETPDAINAEINALTRNIRLADAGKMDQIGVNDFFKTDPIEWTEKWENTIDEVYEEIEKKMGDDHYECGSSQKYWALKTEVLQSHGISWKSPSKMNPDFIFD